MRQCFFFVISSNVARGGVADDTLPRDSRLRETADKSRLITYLIDRFLHACGCTALSRNDKAPFITYVISSVSQEIYSLIWRYRFIRPYLADNFFAYIFY